LYNLDHAPLLYALLSQIVLNVQIQLAADSAEIHHAVFLLMETAQLLESLVAQQDVLKEVYLNNPTNALARLFQNVEIVQIALDVDTVRVPKNV
jgi:hypothetical protein